MLAGVVGDGLGGIAIFCPGWIGLEDSMSVGNDGQLDPIGLADSDWVFLFPCSSDCLRRDSLSLSLETFPDNFSGDWGREGDPSMIAALQPGG